MKKQLNEALDHINSELSNDNAIDKEKEANFIIKYIGKFDDLMQKAMKEKEKINSEYSIHALGAFIMKHISKNIVKYYDGTSLLKDTFQRILDEETDERYEKARRERERSKLH